jgi:hypothetical protein
MEIKVILDNREFNDLAGSNHIIFQNWVIRFILLWKKFHILSIFYLRRFPVIDWRFKNSREFLIFLTVLLNLGSFYDIECCFGYMVRYLLSVNHLGCYGKLIHS